MLFNKDLTEYVESYDGRTTEPVSLPAKIPLLLLQGAEGIAVGMSTRILPHNFCELLRAQVSILKNEPFELFPDFATGGLVDVSEYDDGRGKVRVRARIDVANEKTIVIREIPYSTTTEGLIRTTKVTNLYVIPSGTTPGNPSELLGSERFDDLLERAREGVEVNVLLNHDTQLPSSPLSALVLATLIYQDIAVVPVMLMAPPGKRTAHQPICSSCRESANIRPHEGEGGGTPRPRKLRAASATMVASISACGLEGPKPALPKNSDSPLHCSRNSCAERRMLPRTGSAR